MSKFFVKALIILSLFSVAYFANHYWQSHKGLQAKQSIPFHVYELDAGLEIAEEKERLVLASYTAVWCPSCRKLNEEVFSTSPVANTISSSFVFTSIDHDTKQGKEFAEKFDISGFPRVFVLNHKGEKLGELPHTFNPLMFDSNLKTVLQAYSLNN